MKRLYLIGLVTLISLLQQGCVAWRYTTTPVATGRVLDADTGKPVIGAEVGFRKHESVSTRTKEDGSFSLASDHKWGPAIGIPFEFTLCGGVLYVAAPGYESFEKDVGQRVYHPVDLSEVRLRKKAPLQPQSAVPGERG
ncbi:MAG: hypothetical protein HYV95_10580 [Opitutae bacterium]|nr:hypothetical protein [Opitutae bacterium]